MFRRFRSIGTSSNMMIRSVSKRNTSSTVNSRPYTFKWGVIPVTLVSVPMCYFGAMVAKRGAAFLEEWNIFVPDDDDDD